MVIRVRLQFRESVRPCRLDDLWVPAHSLGRYGRFRLRAETSIHLPGMQ